MEQNTTNRMTMIVKTNKPLLLCYHCKSNAPYLRLNPGWCSMDILINCPCNKTETELPLHQFLKKIGADQLKNIQQPKCNKHHTTAFKYCGNCKLWLCITCCRPHLIAYPEHIVTEYEIDIICELHNTMYTSYCQQCNVKMCESCALGHKEHTVKPYKFKKPIPLKYLKKRLNFLKEGFNYDFKSVDKYDSPLISKEEKFKIK